MDQNQTVNNDLQKAIDDITNTTNSDPVFSDPVAAPSSIPEGDTGELGEPIGPFPEPLPPAFDLPQPLVPPVPEPTPEPAPTLAPEPAPAPAPVVETIIESETETPQTLNTSQVKKAALRDLVPLLDHIDMDALQRFNIYRDIFDDLKDYTILEPAYHAAREIPDEKTRAEALLYLVQSIDKM